jgi:glycosyltransferase involved in cell wall biosynthesis
MEPNTSKLLTIIVPIYNVELYIKQCLDSLIYESAEILLIDDGSTDNSSIIAKEYAKEYNNFHYYKKENGGLSSARNFGINKCKTKYIAFCDSDDWVEQKAYTILANIAEIENCDIVSCGMYLNYDDKEVEVKLINKTFSLNNNKDVISLLENIKVAAWDKVYKYSLFSDNNINYPDGLYFEDTPTTSRLLIESVKVKLINESYYHYRQRDGSITKEKEFNTKYFDIFKGLSILKDYNTNKTEKHNLIYNYYYVRKGLTDSIIRLNQYNVIKNKEYELFIKNKFDLDLIMKFKGKKKYILYLLYQWFKIVL